MPGLTRDQIVGRGTPSLKSERVEVPQWGGYVTVREFTGADTDAVARLATQKGPLGRPSRERYRAQMLIRAIYGDDGQRLFQQADADYLESLPVSMTNGIIEVLTRLNGGENLEDELEKNSGSGPSDDSRSD